ncbi:MAG: glycerophosphodiester phosphodiesterase [Actinomycetota bacterium]|nr:glycerophosphodiester phosphodiesterase [Actinomycetota bacterium]
MSQHCHRIGHGGASALAPANSLAAFDAALEVGVDMVEFDVRGWRGQLVLAHTAFDAGRGASLPLRTALAHLATRRFREVELNLDLKHHGCESALLDTLDRAAVLGRALVSSQLPGVIDAVRAQEPRARVAISVGGRFSRWSRRWGDWRAYVLGGLQRRRWDAIMAQHRLVDERLVSDVTGGGGALYAWTVNDRSSVEQLRLLGVHGIVTSDPRLLN